MTTSWVLILMLHVGPLGDGNSNALTHAEFTTKARCEQAGNKAQAMAAGTVKVIKYICVEK